MTYNRFQIHCIIRVLLLGASVYLLFSLIHYTNFYITIVTFAIIPIVQLFELMHYVQRTNRILAYFLQSIQYDDFTSNFPKNPRDTAFKDLYRSFNQVIRQFQQIRLEKEEQFQYLQALVQHVEIGLIAFTEEGNVDLVNRAFKHLFEITEIKTIHDLKGSHQELYHLLLQITPQEQTLFRVRHNGHEAQFSVHATYFLLRYVRYTLVSFQNIQSELEEQEMQSWQKLIRVLNHEIMNSLTPITSLASTAQSMLSNLIEHRDNAEYTQELGKIQGAVGIIEKRSEGLLNFVNSYRQLTRVPTPVFQEVRLADLFQRIERLLQRQMQDNTIIFLSGAPDDLQVYADVNLLEQVLLNLVKNAISAVEQVDEPSIELRAELDAQGKVMIRVSDNGLGIKEQVLRKIFIPFFTTKKQGSGIGLSVSREIMRLHGGFINVYSQPHVKTVFSLHFPKTT
jgi:two-component system nitrogen regulation sensor histidine kinase NtrY